MSVREQVRASVKHGSIHIRNDKLDATFGSFQRELDNKTEGLQICVNKLITSQVCVLKHSKTLACYNAVGF